MTDVALNPPLGKTEADSGAAWITLWLVGVAFLVYAMVLVGGATRLTDSGLSIVEWQLVTGIFPPFTEAQWQIELEKYRQIPEYQLVNRGMSLEEFKFIYWWEWGHRFLGRVIGLAFAVPLVIFWLKGWLDRRMKLWGVGLLFLGGLQGFIGWYMVSSGLTERVDVSQYRLALHLGMAAIIFALLVRLAYGLNRRPAGASAAGFAPLWAAGAILVFIFLQIILGAFVAGLDAGLTYTSWPLMDGQLIPDGLLLMQPVHLNFFENVLTVQFNHRLAAYLLVIAALAYAVWIWRSDAARAVKTQAAAIAGITCGQALLGILTLIMTVPLSMALAHQGVAFALLALAMCHFEEVRASGSRRAVQAGQ